MTPPPCPQSRSRVGCPLCDRGYAEAADLRSHLRVSHRCWGERLRSLLVQLALARQRGYVPPEIDRGIREEVSRMDARPLRVPTVSAESALEVEE